MQSNNPQNIPTTVYGHALSDEQLASLAHGHIIIIEIDDNTCLLVKWNGTDFVVVRRNDKAAELKEIIDDVNELNDVTKGIDSPSFHNKPKA